MTAPMNAMAELHAELAKVLTAAVKADGVSPAMLSVARQFLKDNGIDAAAPPGSALDHLKDALPDFPEDEDAPQVIPLHG